MRGGRTGMSEFKNLKTPAFVCDMRALQKNLELLEKLQQRSGVKILLALKGFSLYESFSLVKKYLHGAAASSQNEALLAYETFGKELHTYSVAFKASEMQKIAQMSDVVVFNSLSQWKRYYPQVASKSSCGLRINLEMDFDIPQHCNANQKQSRLGVLATELSTLPKEVEGLHLHALCSQNSFALEAVIKRLESLLPSQLKQLKWLNFGGGHAFTCKTYDHDHFISMMQSFQKRYPHLQLYIEPSEAVVHESGVLVATVLDIVHNEVDIAILDVSVEVHMTDVMLTKVPPRVRGTDANGAYHYQLAGNSCAAGDIFGSYRFQEPLATGDTVVFLNQMAYSMVKSTSFNGINPAHIVIKELDGRINVVKEFGYTEYKDRL